MTVIPGLGAFRVAAYSGGSHYGSFPYLITDIGSIPAAVAARVPGQKILVYMNAVAVNQSILFGCDYTYAINNNLILKTSGGQLITLTSATAGTTYIGDIGSTLYRNRWISNVANFLSSNNADGVFIDDLAITFANYASGTPALYPTQAAWQAAMQGWIQAIGPSLQGSGFYVVPNCEAFISGNGQSDTGQLVATWMGLVGPYVDGCLNEAFEENPAGLPYSVRPSGAASSADHFDTLTSGWLMIMDAAQGAGADFHGLSYGVISDVAKMRYVRAAFLLKWNGAGGALYYAPAGTNADIWSSEWTNDIGTPSGAAVAVGVGMKRAYTAGIVFVNPHPSQSQQFTFTGTYQYPNGATVTSPLTLAPKTAAVLNGSGAPPGPDPVNTVLPAITGTPEVGQTLSCSTGTWTNTPTFFQYQWQRDNHGSAPFANIPGAAASAYTLVSADSGCNIDCVVTATN